MRTISRKFLCALLAFLMLVQFVPVQASSVQTHGNLRWSVSGGVLTISGTGEIPADWRPFADESFDSIVISEGITAIGDGKDGEWGSGQFSMLEITSVTLPKSLKHIGVAAFSYCWGLEKIVIPDGVVTIGDYAFRECIDLKEVVIGDHVTSIGAEAFLDCSSLEKATIPESVTSIGSRAFYWCMVLRIYGYPGSCAESYAEYWRIPFSYADDVVVENLSWNVKNDVLTISGTGTIPIYWRPFGDEEFTKVVISEGITAIGDSTYTGVDGPFDEFLDDMPITSITLPDSLTYIGNAAFSNCMGLTQIEIPDGVTSIGDRAFYFCTGLKKIDLPDGVTAIGNESFAFCSSLEKVTIPDGVTTIGNEAFYSCDNLSEIIIPDGVTTIGDGAFADCDNLSEIIIPESVSFIGEDVFSGSRDLRVYGYPGSCVEAYALEHYIYFTYADDVVFDHLSWSVNSGVLTISGTGEFPAFWRPFAEEEITKVIIAEGITAIGDGTMTSDGPFRDLPVTTVTLPNSLVSIGAYAFAGNEYLTDINIPAGVTTIGNDAFSFCEKLPKIVIPDGVNTISEYIFRGCEALTEVNIPDGVTAIGRSAFDGCRMLSDIEVPDGVTVIGRYAFDGCRMLSDIEVPDSVTSIGHNAFTNEFGLRIHGKTDSIAELYANAYDIPFISNGETAGKKLSWSVENDVLTISGAGEIPAYWRPFADEVFSSIVISEGITGIGEYHIWREGLFSGLPVTTVSLPSTMEYIGDCAFHDCPLLECVTIEDGLTSIMYSAFENCANLETLYLPASVTSIESYAFFGCDNLTLYVEAGSCAEAYAIEQEIPYHIGKPCHHVWDGMYCSLCGAIRKNPFTDVPEGSFYYLPVLWAVSYDITNGTSATTFSPDAQCMRAHVVTFLWRSAGSPEPQSSQNPFVDVNKSDFYYKAVLWAVENGITNGLDATHFGPQAYCNRAQVVTFLWRAQDKPDPTGTDMPFTDVQSGAFYEKPVLWAVENGITNGLSATSFGIDAICNRAQIVTFLYRAYN